MTITNPALLDALSSSSVVYIFGAGISSSLVDRNYGWRTWVLDGAHHMKDAAAAKALVDFINADKSADDLIDAASKVIDCTKSDGTYDEWMRGGFESASVVNTGLVEALRLLKLPQDVFITTNYDLALEEATGLGIYTKDDPGLVFKMVKSGMCSSIVHIHGAYSSARGIDNIVATREQYEALYDNEGAQFIQNLLGTKPLVFIGCGQTTDDKNIAHFIRFACDQLKIDVPCFYLKRIGDITPALPDYFHVIDYGSAYDDLSEFISEMAQCRNKALAEKAPIIGRTLHSDTGSLGKYHYANEELGFVGRKVELNALEAFLGDSRQILWWAITGQGGSGKSRLAYELLKENEHKWFGFFINDAATASDAKDFRPFCNTIVTIDYVKGREGKAAAWVSILLGKFRQTGFNLRILLVERESDMGHGSWYSKFYEALGKCDRGLFDSASFSTMFLTLGDLDDDAVAKLIGDVRRDNGLPADTWQDDRLRDAYHKKFERLRYRPLFVQLYVEAWIANKCTEPDYDSFEGVIEASLLKEQERWLEFFDGNSNVVKSFIRLLIRAAAGGELSESNVPVFYKGDWANLKEYFNGLTLPGRQRKESYRNFLADLTQNFEQDGFVLKTYYPDIINEYMFAYYVDNDIDEVVAELWENAGAEFAVFMQRAQADFGGNEVIAKAVSDSSDGEVNPDRLLARLARLKKRVVKPGETLESLKENIDKEYDFWHRLPYVENAGEEDSRELRNAMLKLAGLRGCAIQYGALALLDDMDRCMDEMLSMKGELLDILKIDFLEERMNVCLRAGFADLGRKYENARRDIFNRTDDPEMKNWSRLSGLQEKRNAMMGHLFHGEVYEAKEILNRAGKETEFSSAEEVELLAGMATQYAKYLTQFGPIKYENYVVSILDRCREAFPDNMEIVASYYDGMSARLYGNSLDLMKSMRKGLSDKKYEQLRMEALQRLDEIKGYGPKIKADTWGLAAGVTLNLVDADADVLSNIAHEAESRLRSEFSVETAKTWMYCQQRLHELNNEKVPKEIVNQGFAYYLRDPTSETTRECFLMLLRHSTEKDKKSTYMLPSVQDSLAQDFMFNPMYGADAAEQMIELMKDSEFARNYSQGSADRDFSQDLLFAEAYPDSLFCDGSNGDELFGPLMQTVHTVKKVGRNDPCPCGSGKKYKKCCGRK